MSTQRKLMQQTKQSEHQPTSIKHFEENIERIESIADSLDSGDVPLSAMIELYEEGMKIIQESRAILAHAELKITVIQQGTTSQDTTFTT